MSFSLYVHIPYCLVKCPYCDFNAYGGRSWPEERYVDALCAELRYAVEQPVWRAEQVATIYFGGGTPSLFAPASIERFLCVVAQLCSLAADPEISLEADPASVSQDTLGGFGAGRVNRLSFGVQSFQPAVLKTLGRLHSRHDAQRAVGWAREAGFGNLNLDLMFGVPGQTLALLEADLTQTLAYRPEHISIYNLSYEEGTPFFVWRQTGRLQPVDEELEVAMFELIQDRCLSHGYHQYEISNFARSGFDSQHNRRYWTGQNYLGLGAGAHSFCREPGWGRRWSNEASPRVYMAKAVSGGDARCFEEELSQDQAQAEFMFLSLRQLDGFAPEAFAARFGVNLETAFPQVNDLIGAGVLQQEAGRVKLTRRGLLIADTVFAAFV